MIYMMIINYFLNFSCITHTYNQTNLPEDVYKTIADTAKEYTKEIFENLREYEYNPMAMKLYIVGGGGCLIRNFADYDKSRVTINGDIHATAKGYEYLAELGLKRGVNNG